MKTLIVHTEVETTKFLTGIYSTLINKTVITAGIGPAAEKEGHETFIGGRISLVRTL